MENNNNELNENKNFEEVSKYGVYFTEEGLFNKIMKFAKVLGTKFLYVVLVLFYTLKEKDVPAWAKAAIVGALGYFILPTDLVPDILPAAGFADDWGVVLAAIAAVAFYVDKDVKEKAKGMIKDWFGDFDENDIKDLPV